MKNGCIGDCLACGKCGAFAILDSFGETQGFERREGHGIAVDIGTTSVVLALVDLESGKVLARNSFMNPQRAFGPDVISRISAAGGGHLEDLRRGITQRIAAGVDELLNAQGLSDLTEMVVAGNTAMTYLLLGFPCESLGAAPFKPAYSLKDSYSYADIFGGNSRCPVRIVPWLAAFVGGDITAGLLSVLPHGDKRFLLIDLGTNGEMALYDDGKLTVTATAAGPAFEGSGHDGGASAVLNDLAQLVRSGMLGESGILEDGAPGLFTQQEIRDLQLAKSAVRSGIDILTGGTDYDSLDAVYLAGGIGQAMNPDSAAAVGLLPDGMRGMVRAIGNASLGGAVRWLLCPSETSAQAKILPDSAVEINLAAHPNFNDYFMDNMMFEVM